MIKWDADLNKELRRAVDNFNKKVRRAEVQNLKRIPERASVTSIKEEFKNRFATKRDLNARINELRRLNLKDLQNTRTLKSGEIVSRYEYKTAVSRRARARRAVEREIELQKDVVDPMMTMTTARLDALRSQLKKLKDRITSRDTIRSITSYFNRYKTASKKQQWYDNFFDVVEKQFETINDDDLSEDKKRELMTKLQQLSPEELARLKANDPYIKLIFEGYKEAGTYSDYDSENLSLTYDQILQNIDQYTKN